MADTNTNQTSTSTSTSKYNVSNCLDECYECCSQCRHCFCSCHEGSCYHVCFVGLFMGCMYVCSCGDTCFPMVG